MKYMNGSNAVVDEKVTQTDVVSTATVNLTEAAVPEVATAKPNGMGATDSPSTPPTEPTKKRTPQNKPWLAEPTVHITAEYVAKLTKVAENEVMGFVNAGRLIAEYVQKIAPDGKPKFDPYRALEADPNSHWKASQLRNYRQCYDLYNELNGKGGAPQLPMTFFVCVLPTKLNLFKKQELLKQAQDEKLSVSELKARVAMAVGKKPARPEAKPSTLEDELKKLETQTQALFAFLVSLHDMVMRSEAPAANQAKIRDSLKLLITFAKERDYLPQSTVHHVSLGTVTEKKPRTNLVRYRKGAGPRQRTFCKTTTVRSNQMKKETT